MCNPIQSISDAVSNTTKSIADIVAPVDPLGAAVLNTADAAATNPNVQKAAPYVAAAVAAYYTGGLVGGSELATIGGDAGATLTGGAVVDGASLAADGSLVADAVAGGATPYVVDGASLAADGSLVTDAVAGGASTPSSTWSLADAVRGSQQVAQVANSINAISHAVASTSHPAITSGSVFLPNTTQKTAAQNAIAGIGGPVAAGSKLSSGAIIGLLAVAGLTIWGLK